MSYAKLAEMIKMQFGMLNRVGPGNVYLFIIEVMTINSLMREFEMGCRCLHRKGHFWGVWLEM